MEFHKPSSRIAVCSLVASGHVLLVLCLINERPISSRAQHAAERSGTLIFVERVRPAITPPNDATKSITTSARSRRPESGEVSEISPGTSATPEIDWHAEAERSAADMAPQFGKQLQTECQPEPHRSPHARCKQRDFEPKWNPEPQAIGVQGLIPYVRVGKCCVVGLGFFGCALGKLPEADGQLFETMDDPNRPHSSVPDVPR